jgi:hypothetical protein
MLNLNLKLKAKEVNFKSHLRVESDYYIVEGNIVIEPNLRYFYGGLTIYLPPHKKEDEVGPYVEQEEIEKIFETELETFQELINFLESEEFKELWKREDKKAIEESIEAILEGKKKIVPTT